MKRFTQALVVLSALALTVPARAVEIQKPGNPQVWPGKWMFGFQPIGVQASFDGYSAGGYKLSLDIAYRVKEWSKISLWVGAMASYTLPLYTCGQFRNANGDIQGCGHDIGLHLLVRITLEKLLKLPLVPYVEFGLGADMLVYPELNGQSSHPIGAGIPLRLGGGMHYWITKNFGAGFETHVGLGPGIYPREGVTGGCGVSSCTLFYGYWDFLIGLRASF